MSMYMYMCMRIHILCIRTRNQWVATHSYVCLSVRLYTWPYLWNGGATQQDGKDSRSEQTQQTKRVGDKKKGVSPLSDMCPIITCICQHVSACVSTQSEHGCMHQHVSMSTVSMVSACRHSVDSVSMCQQSVTFTRVAACVNTCMRAWRNTVETVLLEISNSMKPYHISPACTSKLGPMNDLWGINRGQYLRRVV